MFLIGVGCLIGITFLLPSSLWGSSAGSERAFAVPSGPAAKVQTLAGKKLAPGQAGLRGANGAFGGRRETAAGMPAPKSKMLRMSIPAMSRIENDEIPTAKGTNEGRLHDYAAIHLEGTGFPWEPNSNVYVAGHRVGYPATDSFLAFYDLNELTVGDKVFVSDAKDRRYTYRVFRVIVVGPRNLSVTRPVRGRDLLTLQTCTLPNYTQRLIVRAEKVSTEKARSQVAGSPTARAG